MKGLICLFFVILFLNSCTEPFDTGVAGKETIVIDGVVSNDTSCYYKFNYVRVIRTKGSILEQSDGSSDLVYTPVVNAIVYIRDDKGNQWLLPPVQKTTYYKRFLRNYSGVDTVELWPNLIMDSRSWYYDSTLVGQPGRTYYLSVTVDSVTYTASCYMPPVPKIDSIERITFEDKTQKETYTYPAISFKDDPITKDYYMFDLTYGSSNAWSMEVLSDVLLPNTVERLNVFKGQSVWNQNAYTDWMELYVNMHSLTFDAYSYYKTLIQLYRTDGGTFKQAPASPKGNISGGAQGFFRASAISHAYLPQTFE